VQPIANNTSDDLKVSLPFPRTWCLWWDRRKWRSTRAGGRAPDATWCRWSLRLWSPTRPARRDYQQWPFSVSTGTSYNNKINKTAIYK